MQKECILASLLYCFWCFTWGTHSVWAHHTTGWWNGVWWVVMPVRQLRVTASACWKREVLLVLYMSGKCAYRTKDTCICVCKVLNSVCCFGGMWKVMFSNLQHISWIIVVVLWVVVPCTLLHLYYGGLLGCGAMCPVTLVLWWSSGLWCHVPCYTCIMVVFWVVVSCTLLHLYYGGLLGCGAVYPVTLVLWWSSGLWCHVPCYTCIMVVFWVVVPCTLLHLYSSSSFSFHLFPVFPCLFISSSYLFHLYLIALYLWYCSSGG